MPKLEPLKEFICDQCGQIIEEPGDGWVEWLAYWEDGTQVVYNFRIVHHKQDSPNQAGNCYYTDLHEDYEGTASTDHLQYFLEDQGLARALAKLQRHAEGNARFKNKEDYLQLLELIRRITIPYYEEGRQYLDKYYLEWTGEGKIIYSRIDSEDMQKFLNWIEEREYDYDFR